MKKYRLEGRMELLPDDIWGGCDPTIYLPPLAAAGSRSHEALFRAVDEQGSRHALAWEGGLACDVVETANQIRDFRGRRSPRPWMTFCPFHPHRISPRLRSCVRSVLGVGSRFSSARHQAFPRWPIEPTLAVWRSLARAAGLEPPRLRWPHDERYAVCLSHDVDTAEGQKAVVALAEIEEDLGLRSAWFLCPGNYQVDRGLWSEMAARGHEIGCHGWIHDFKLPYLDPAAIAARLDRALRSLEGVSLPDASGVAGFRSPALLRTPALLDAVAERFAYDSSIPDTVRLHGGDGSASAEPYSLGPIVEVPVTVPYDGELSALGVPLHERLNIWQFKIDWVKRQGALVHLLTHPDPQFTGNEPERDVYRRALTGLVADRDEVWFALPVEVARHVRAENVTPADSISTLIS